MADRIGQPLMPWQRQVAMIGGEIDATTGLPAYREIIITVPRQSGKTTLIMSWELQRALGWGSPQRIVYSAQTGKDAREKLVDDQMPILERFKKPLGIRQLNRGVGNEGVWFGNGSAIKLLSSSEDSGHGKTLDLAIKDEFFADEDDRRDQSLVPAMTTKALAQILTATTAGTERSVPWNAKQRLGRQYALDGRTDTIAYFEWSADPDQWDPTDEDSWWEFMPALGHTIQLPAIRHARDTLSPDEFRRAYGNIPTGASNTLIPAEAWDLVNRPDAAGTGRMVFGIDVAEDRASAAIVAVSADRVVEVVDHRAGVAWLPERCRELTTSHPGAALAVDAGGPAASFLPELEKLPGLFKMKGGDLAAASALFYDSVADMAVTVRRHPALDEAVASAARKVSGDRWMFARKGCAADQAPLVAAVVGLWAVESGGSVDPVANVW